MASEWDVVSTTPAPSGDEWSVVKVEAAEPTPVVSKEEPKQSLPNKESPYTAKEFMRQLGLTARATVGGASKALTFPVRAVGSAVAGGMYQAGNLADSQGLKDAARYVENNFGGTGGDIAANKISDAAGLSKPQNAVERGVQAGGEALVGGVANGALGAAKNAPMAVKALLPGTNTATGMVVDTAVGAGLEAAPESTGTALAATALAAKGKQYARAKSVSNIEKKIAGSVTPDVDAQVIKNLAADAQNRLKLNPMNGKQTQMTAASIRDSARDYKAAVRMQLKESGVNDPKLNELLLKTEPSQADIDAVRGTPAGDAVAEAVLMATRTNELTKPKQSNAALAWAREGLSTIPMWDWSRRGLNAALGGRATREDAVKKLTSEKNVEAANNFLAKQPEAPAYLQSKGALSTVAEQNQARLASDKAAREAAQTADKQELGALELKARKVSRTPGGGAYQALQEHTGLSSDDLNKALRIAEKIPEASKAVKSIRIDGANTKKDAIYPVTDIIKKIADDMGMQRQGMLTQTTPAGALTGAQSAPIDTQRMLNHAASVKVRQNAYKDAQKAADGIGSAEGRKAARGVAQKLVSTPSAADRLKLIDELEAKYPEAQGIFDTVRQFK
jgi:hypothetical protein